MSLNKTASAKTKGLVGIGVAFGEASPFGVWGGPQILPFPKRFWDYALGR